MITHTLAHGVIKILINEAHCVHTQLHWPPIINFKHQQLQTLQEENECAYYSNAQCVCSLILYSALLHLPDRTTSLQRKYVELMSGTKEWTKNWDKRIGILINWYFGWFHWIINKMQYFLCSVKLQYILVVELIAFYNNKPFCASLSSVPIILDLALCIIYLIQHTWEKGGIFIKRINNL